MDYVDLRPGRIAFSRAGAEGDPVVLVHGGWDDHRLWDPLVDLLRSSLQLVTYDRRGHGESSGREGRSPVADDARDLAALLERTDHFPAHVVAHGYGGAVALHLAVDRPELLRSLSLHEPPWSGGPPQAAEDPPGREFSGEIGRVLRVSREIGLEAGARAYLESFGAPGERWERAAPVARGILLENAEAWAREAADPESGGPGPEALVALALPALVTFGRRSPGGSASAAERLGRALPNSTVLGLPDAGHWAPRSDPHLFAGVLGSFLLERNVPST